MGARVSFETTGSVVVLPVIWIPRNVLGTGTFPMSSATQNKKAQKLM